MVSAVGSSTSGGMKSRGVNTADKPAEGMQNRSVKELEDRMSPSQGSGRSPIKTSEIDAKI